MGLQVVSGLMYSKKRRTILELLTPKVRKLWKEWDLRVAVLLSVTLQIVLIVLGNRRKYDRKLWIRIVLWSAYLVADYVATFALGILSNNLTDTNDGGSVSAKVEITVLWAPFLLLHLGGPDTITAYALEDNELWLRHLLELLVQTGITVYVWLMAWAGGSLPSFLFIPMFFAGLFKYGERTWVLWSASNEKLRESILVSNASNPGNAEDDEEHGYIAEEDLVPEFSLLKNLPFSRNTYNIPDEMELRTANGLLEVTTSLFLDAILRHTVTEKIRSIFKDLSFGEAFKIIEMELALIYDLFYTKVPLLYTSLGSVLRLITIFLTSLVLVLFTSLVDRNKYSKVDLCIMFVLLVIAIILEVYSALLQLYSDRFGILLSIRKKNSVLQYVTSHTLFKFPRWSNTMGQYSILSFSLKEKPLCCRTFLKRLWNIDKKLEKWLYIDYEVVPEDFKEVIFHFYKWKVEPAVTASQTSLSTVSLLEGFEPPRRFVYWEMRKMGGFAQSILIWNIATEICYCLDQNDMEHQETLRPGMEYQEPDVENHETHRSDMEHQETPRHDTEHKKVPRHCVLSNQISKYMLYLIVVHPSMLSVDHTNQIIFQDTSNEMRQIMFEETTAKDENRGAKVRKVQACKKLLQWYTDQQSGKRKQRSGRSVLHKACELAEHMNTCQDLTQKWDSISRSWLDIIDDAASRCKGNQHATQLRRGGEFLTHVWLLKTYFGSTRISK